MIPLLWFFGVMVSSLALIRLTGMPARRRGLTICVLIWSLTFPWQRYRTEMFKNVRRDTGAFLVLIILSISIPRGRRCSGAVWRVGRFVFTAARLVIVVFAVAPTKIVLRNGFVVLFAMWRSINILRFPGWFRSWNVLLYTLLCSHSNVYIYVYLYCNSASSLPAASIPHSAFQTDYQVWSIFHALNPLHPAW